MCMRTNIDLDDDLVEEAQRLTGLESKRGVVHEALRVLIESKRRRSLNELAGKIRFTDDYDHKKLRERS